MEGLSFARHEIRGSSGGPARKVANTGVEIEDLLLGIGHVSLVSCYSCKREE